MIQPLEDMIRRLGDYGLEFKDSDGFTHDWCTLIPAVEMEYKASIHSSTGKTSAMLEKESWDKSHKPPNFKVGHLVLVSNLNLNNIKGPKKLKDFFAVIFMIRALHFPDAMKLELTGELMNKHPDSAVSLIKPYHSSDKELFSLRKKPPLQIPPVEKGEEDKNVKVLKERRTGNKKQKGIPFKV
ncbi:hypothetical protein O181_022189 [Austropuccinia psidii MF-1]|uniref:Uncharacterized protein n=1 Tax=Austropuccinia psidii MF-1 TaxID=1389203 RepID=A0A9Q3CC59_9BASI|nr:hypothetical protein [Austropuccinia psidii MF-1]